MKTSTWIALALSALGLCAVVFSFVKNSSPYVTIAQAKQLDGDNLHLAGDLDKSSLDIRSGSQIITFRLTDDDGATIDVLYRGIAPSNMGEADRVVAIGSLKGDQFEAHKLLLKCPSKYEGEQSSP